MDVEYDGWCGSEDVLEIPVAVGEEEDPYVSREYVVEEPALSACLHASSSSSSSSEGSDGVGKELVLYNDRSEKLRSELDLWPRMMRSSVGTFPDTSGILSVLKDKLPMLHCYPSPLQCIHGVLREEPEIPNIGVKREHYMDTTREESEIEWIHPAKSRRVAMDRGAMEWRDREVPSEVRLSHSIPACHIVRNGMEGSSSKNNSVCDLVGKRERCCDGLSGSVSLNGGGDVEDDVLMEAALDCGRSPKRRKHANF
jgi:hypothetical protein